MAHVLVGLLAAEPGTALWAALLGEGAPLIAALIVSLVLARAGFHEKLNAYRQDTLTLMQLRSDTVQKQLDEAKGEMEELRRAGRRRERHIEYLELELETRHAGRPPRRARWAEDDAAEDDAKGTDEEDDA